MCFIFVKFQHLFLKKYESPGVSSLGFRTPQQSDSFFSEVLKINETLWRDVNVRFLGENWGCSLEFWWFPFLNFLSQFHHFKLSVTASADWSWWQMDWQTSAAVSAGADEECCSEWRLLSRCGTEAQMSLSMWPPTLHTRGKLSFCRITLGKSGTWEALSSGGLWQQQVALILPLKLGQQLLSHHDQKDKQWNHGRDVLEAACHQRIEQKVVLQGSFPWRLHLFALLQSFGVNYCNMFKCERLMSAQTPAVFRVYSLGDGWQRLCLSLTETSCSVTIFMDVETFAVWR